MGKEKIFEDTLTKKYRHEDFCRFALEFFSGMNVIAPDLPQKPASNFSGHVKEFYFIGNYQSGGEKIIVLAVNLNKDKSVDRARSVQRNFVKSIMGNDADGACAAFYSDAAPDKWRLSFLKIDYVLLESKVDVTITPAKRCSYLVGENEPCNTAYQQLYKIFADDSKLPSLEELAEAFSVERVTQEFFEIYKTKYNQVCELLKNNSAFLNKKFTAEQFAKKLLGQIVFLYFLQKKGWLGVDKDSEWGSGQVKFMRKIFDEAVRDGKNFFKEVLEPLFYNALNCERPDDFYQPLNTRIPFLNGGLFEELDGYDWRGNVLSLGNEIFSNAADDGILDIFDRYNFTINEDAPHEREVAVDPEMLGKIFENLLENNDRKAKGAFYTPREIVHYMCREALINYLIERTKIPEKAVRDFILHGDFLKDEDAANFKAGKKLFIDAQIFNRLAEIDNLLAEIKVADPAVGSGAFPLGMLNEIVTAREVLTVYMSLAANFQAEGRALYDLKLNTIKNCIFACDIEPSAVDIAKLRLWLSIVIDDVPKDKNFTPHRLPNLDCNIICGNSLVDEFNGVDLLSVQGDIFYDNAARISDRKSLVKLQHELFDETKPALKKILRKKIRDIYDKIVEKNLKDAALIENYREAAREKSLPFVLWQLYFPTVFEDGGFDIVIGNPPYVDSETMTKEMPKLRKLYAKKFKAAKGNWDLFVIFIERGLELIKKGGQLSMIVPNKLISAPYAEPIRKILSENQLQELRDYSNVNVFKNAAVYPIVFSVKKTVGKNSVFMRGMKNIIEVESENLIAEKIFYSDTSWDKYFNSNAEILSVIEKMKRFPALETFAKVNGAATVAEAYLIKNFLHEAIDGEKNFVKFINTGGLDKYKSFHAAQFIRYLKGKYFCPVVSVEDLKNMSERRLNESLGEKIIIGGMNKFLECFYDSGEYLAGKSTTIVYDHPHLKFITAILNSKLMSFYYQKLFGSMSLAGGFYRIGVPQIKILPIAFPENQTLIKSIESKVAEIQRLYSTASNDLRAQEILSELDKEIYKIYGLSTSEIKAVEASQNA